MQHLKCCAPKGHVGSSPILGTNTIYMIYIISSKGKWGVYKRNSKRSIKNFLFRDLAFHYATKFNETISVHNKDGLVDFIHFYKI
jgi:hypothetical protein